MRRAFRRGFLQAMWPSLALLAAACTHARNAAPEITALAEQWRAAEMHNDAVHVASLLAPEFVYVGPDGISMSRSEDLSAIANPVLRLGSYQIANASVQCRGEVCIETGTEVLEDAFLGDQRLDGRYRYVTVWRQIHGAWKAVYAQETAIADSTGK